MKRSSLIACLVALAAGQSTPTATSTVDLNRYPPEPQETVCGDIVNANLYDTIDCLTSVPFNSAVAVRFLQYLNDTLQYQANLAYLRDPPAGYQQPSVDFFAQIQAIEGHVNAGDYHNQYAFEVDVQSVLQRLHDGHVTVYGGISSFFTFLSPIYFVSVSPDGKQTPNVYIKDDLLAMNAGGDAAQPVVEINGLPAADALKSIASNESYGLVEPNADWNSLMWTPAQDLFGLNSLTDGALFYPGDQLEFTYQNGTSQTYDWFALFESPGYTGPLETGGDFYNFFVLGLVPANFAEQATLYYNNMSASNAGSDTGSDSNANANTTASWHHVESAYPETMSHQADLGLYANGGTITGYVLPDNSTAILSIPTFDFHGSSVGTFSDAISDFMSNATAHNAGKIIIDLQQNDGGSVALAFSAFSQFFGNASTFAGSRMRAHSLANTLGETFTSTYDDLLQKSSSDITELIGIEWVVTDRINAQTGRNFTSWSQYYGPVSDNGDTFTLTQEYDLSNPLFADYGLGVDFAPCIYTDSCEAAQWKAEDIVILTDAVCASTCALFVEMMHQVGVRSVVMGGLPETGPMQAVGGSRGAVEYSGADLESDYANAAYLSDAAAAALPVTPLDTGMALTYTGFTLRDQIRRNEKVPNQVLYLPADCRLYWSFANFNDYERLWQDVYSAMFVDPSLCVAGSTNVASPPVRRSLPLEERGKGISYYITHPAGHATFGGKPTPESNLNLHSRKTTNSLFFCTGKSTGTIADGYPCVDFTVDCGCNGDTCQGQKTFNIHAKTCQNGDSSHCPGGLYCYETGPLSSDTQNSQAFAGNPNTDGYCAPEWSPQDMLRTCKSVTQSTLESVVTNNQEDPIFPADQSKKRRGGARFKL